VILALPAETPVTTPEDDTVATLVVPDVHAPPGGVVLKAVVRPWHTDVLPVMPAGNGLTVIVFVASHPKAVV
jgi:hypothetical protein